jgi:hypothetical protein
MKPTWNNWCARLNNPGAGSGVPEISVRAQMLAELLTEPAIRNRVFRSAKLQRKIAQGFGIKPEDTHGRLMLAYMHTFLDLELDPETRRLATLSNEERATAQATDIRRLRRSLDASFRKTH